MARTASVRADLHSDPDLLHKPRYRALLPALVLLASRGLECLREAHGGAVAWVVVLLFAALNYLALGLGLYF